VKVPFIAQASSKEWTRPCLPLSRGFGAESTAKELQFYMLKLNAP